MEHDYKQIAKQLFDILITAPHKSNFTGYHEFSKAHSDWLDKKLEAQRNFKAKYF